MKWASDHFALYVLSKKPFIRYAAVFVLLLCLSLAWRNFLYLPLQSNTASQKIIYNQLQQQLRTMQQQIGTLDTMHKTVTELQQQIIVFDKNMQRCATQEHMFWFISCIKKHNLLLLSCQPMPLQKKDWYCKQRVCCQLQGNFIQFVEFFSDLNKQNLLMQCKQLIFEKENSLLKAHCVFDFIHRIDNEKI